MEEITLEKIDLVRDRTGVGYGRAHEALQESGGDVVRAILWIERQDEAGGAADDWQRRLRAGGDRLARRLRSLWRAGSRTRVVVRRGDRRLVDVPATVGVLGALLAPALTAAGVVAALATRSTLSVEPCEEGTGGAAGPR
jgi:hypothetical protein